VRRHAAGNHNLGEWLRSGTTDSDSDYVYWLDQTSRLYYSRIDVPQYRDAIAGSMGVPSPMPMRSTASCAIFLRIVRRSRPAACSSNAARRALIDAAIYWLCDCARLAKSVPSGRDNGRDVARTVPGAYVKDST
jgi:hypothetical protein